MGLSASIPPTHRLELGGYLYFVGAVQAHSDGVQRAFVQGLLEVLQKIPLLFNENTSTFRKKYLYFSEEVLLLLKGSTLTSRKKYLYFLPNVILLSVKCYITFRRMLYYFWSEVILLSTEGYMTRPASANDFPLKGILLPTQSLIPSRPKRSLRGRHQIRLSGRKYRNLFVFLS